MQFNPLGLSVGLNSALAAVSPEAQEAHSSIMEYTGPETCVSCHEVEAQEVHGSVHYQQTGMTPNVTNIADTAGKGEDAFNTYCGSIRTSPFFTCAGCHVGNGLPPEPDMTAEQLNNIDCLMCHQDDYARVGAPPYEDVSVVGEDGFLTNIQIPVEETFRFMPDESKMTVSILEAARTVHPTTRKTCLRCHAGASGSNGGKRGDLSFATVDPPITSDIHMSSHGEDLTCSNCHSAENHRFKGRGLDLRPNDVADRFTCAECHTDEPHNDFSGTKADSMDRHATKVACQTCHIPEFAKDISTELVRDWTHTHFSAAACGGRGGWLPSEVRASNVVPTYRWFDGTSEVYVLGQVPSENADGEKAFGVPHGAVDSGDAKIYPMKEHRSVSAQHDASGLMIPHSTFTFFTQNSFTEAVLDGMAQEGLEGSYSLVDVHTYQTINHGVEDEANALSCSDCHETTTRIDLQGELGYGLKATEQEVCTQCHKYERSEGFDKNHVKHVTDKRIDCSACHSFSRQERGLNPDLTAFIKD
ncbi:MAG: cytochrome c3 family protein [Pseudomonadota bacterium]